VQLDRLELRLDDGTSLVLNGQHFYDERPTVLAHRVGRPDAERPALQTRDPG
jgi:hypothetical protein